MQCIYVVNAIYNIDKVIRNLKICFPKYLFANLLISKNAMILILNFLLQNNEEV